MAPSRPQIRAFLSSTFSDFLEERSLLVKQVFPELRRKARERGVEVVEVDLRWGITEEQSKQGKTIGICLDEIERCRPYFIGLIGDRYGWVPQLGDYSPELLARQNWIAQHQGGASVTELEILHGVLNNPEMAGRAFFYFRDPAYSDAKASAGEGGWRSDDTQEREKLEQLKQKIRNSGFPVVEKGLATPQAIADRIEADLWSLIEEQYPDEPKTDVRELEVSRHASYRADRTGLYLGGESYIQQLQDWISAGEQRILITGESGSGKSALIANWVAAHGNSHPDDVIFCHHLGCSNDANAMRPLLARMIDSASRLLVEAEELSEPLKVPQDWWELVSQLTNTLSRLSVWAIRQQRRWIWVLDGLDKLDLEDQQSLPWLPLVLPEGVHLVASALDCQVRTLLQERQFTELTIGPLGGREQEQLIQKYLKLYTKELVPALRQKITSHRQGSSPLFLRVLLEELRLCGRFETLAEQLQGYLTAESVADLYELVLQRLEDDGHGDAVRKVMTALWASRAGLSENELLAITGLVHAQWAPIGIGLQEALCEANGRLVFGHDFLRQAVRDRYLPTEEQRRQAHSELADWFEGREGWDGRDAEEWPWQLQQAKRIDDLRDLLLNVNLLSNLVKDVGSQEVFSYWQAARAEANGELDELIAEAVEEEIEKRRGDSIDLKFFLLLLATLLEKAGLYRGLLVRLRSLELELAEADQERDEESILIIISKLAESYHDKGDYGVAKAFYERCLEASERLLGPDHRTSLTTVANLGLLYSETGDFEQAEAHYVRCLEADKRLLGPEHPSTLSTIANLAVLFLRKGDYERAEDYGTRCMEAEERLLGPEHPSTLTTVNNLGSLYRAKGDNEKAEAYYKRDLEASERLLGPEHPSTLISVNNLAGLYQDKGDYERAEAYYRRDLEASERRLGPEHPHTLTSVSNLAVLYSDKGDYEKAEVYYRRALEARERLLGPEHPDTLTIVSNLGAHFSDKGDNEQAEVYYRRALEARERRVGLENPDTDNTRYSLAKLLSDQGRYSESIPLRRLELSIAEQRDGRNASGTLTSLDKLAEDLYWNDEQQESELLYREALAGRIAVLGDDDPDTIASRHGLARCLSAIKCFEEAITLRRIGLAWCQRNYGYKDAVSLYSMHALGCDLLANEQTEEALDVLKACLQRRQATLGSADKDCLDTHDRVVEALSLLGRQAEAIATSKAVWESLEQELGENHPAALVQLAKHAKLHQKLNLLEDSELLWRDCLIRRETSLGLDHPETLGTVYGLAEVLSQQGHPSKSIPLRRRELTWCRHSNGDLDLGTLMSISQLAIDLLSNGELEEAEQLFRELVTSNQALDSRDIRASNALANLARTLLEADKLEDALDYAQQGLSHRLKYVGADCISTNTERLFVASMLYILDRVTEALVLLSQLEDSLNSQNQLSDDDQKLLVEASALRVEIEGEQG